MIMERVLSYPSIWLEDASKKIHPRHPDSEHEKPGWPHSAMKAEVVAIPQSAAYYDDASHFLVGQGDLSQRFKRLGEACTKGFCGLDGDTRKLHEQRRSKELFSLLQVEHEEHFRAYPGTLGFLLRECIRVKSLVLGKQVHAFILRMGLEDKTFIGNNLVNMYMKCGSVQDAWHVFHTMPERNVISWTAIIAGYNHHGHGTDAIKLFHQMEEEGVEPNEVTFACALKACACIRALDQGLQFHSHIIERGLDEDIFLGSTLIDMYVKCGSIKLARQMFDRMPKQDVVAWTAIIAGCVLHGLCDVALGLFGQMQLEGVKPNELTFVSVLNACALLAALEVGKQIHNLIVECRFESNLFIGSSLVDMYSKCGSVEHARQVFDKLPQRNVVSWTAMITGYVMRGENKQALELFYQMHKEGVKPTEVTFVSVIKACAHLTTLEDAKCVHAHIINHGFESEVPLVNLLTDMYLKCGSIEKACQVFDKIPVRDVVSFTVMITGYSQYGFTEKAIRLLWLMQLLGVKPDSIALTSALNACASLSALEQGKQIHAHIIEVGFDSDVFVRTTLLNMYVKCGSTEDAYRAFNRVPERDVVAWTAMISGFSQHGLCEEALSTFQKMLLEGVIPNAITFVSALNACVPLTALEQGEQIHRHIVESGAESDVFVATALVDMYAKCGSIEEAAQVFNRTPEKGVVLWNTIIAGYAQHGDAKMAIDLADRMQEEGVKMDWVTFTSVLSACSHGGLVNKGRYYFNLMRQSYDVVPTAEHLACVVDLLGRAGHLEEAEDFARENLFQSSAVTWIALLGSCKIHNNVELANAAVKQVLELDPLNAAAPVLLSNLCATAGR